VVYGKEEDATRAGIMGLLSNSTAEVDKGLKDIQANYLEHRTIHVRSFAANSLRTGI